MIRYEGGVRHIGEIKLREISLVTLPAQAGVPVISVTCLADAPRVIDTFPVDRPGTAEFAELLNIEMHVKRLLADGTEAPDASILAGLRDLAKLAKVNQACRSPAASVGGMPTQEGRCKTVGGPNL